MRDIETDPPADTLSSHLSDSVFKSIFNWVWDGILVADIDTHKFVLANNEMCVMMGYTNEEFYNLSVSDIHPPEDLPKVIFAFEALAKSKVEFVRNIPCLRKDGSVFYSDIRGKKLSFGDREYNIGFFSNITERKKREDEALAREVQLLRYQDAILRIASDPAIPEGDFFEVARKVTEIASETLKVELVGIWILSEDNNDLECIDLFDRSAGEHTGGTVLSMAEYPEYYKAITTERAIAADDAMADPRTREFKDIYLIPVGVTSMMDAGIRAHGKIVGVVCFEHKGEKRRWNQDEITFAGEVADQMAKAFIAQERLDALAVLKEKESQIFGILKAAPAGIGLERDRIFVWVSERVQEMTGYSEEELIGSSTRMLYENEDEFLRVGIDKYEQMQESGISTINTIWIRKDGSPVEISLSTTAVTSEGSIFTALDIGDRRKVEEQLRASETKFRALTENTSDLTGILDSDNNFRYISPSVEKISKFSRDEFLGVSITAFLTDDKIPLVEQALANARENPFRSVPVPVFRAQAKSGEWVYMEGIATFMPDVPGVDGIVLNCRDITERQSVEDALKNSEQFLANVFNSIQDGISVLDKDFRILRVNPVMNEWYKANTPLEGKYCYKCYHNSDSPCEICPSRKCFESGMAEHDVVRGMEGSPVQWIELFSFPIRDPKTNEVIGAVEYVRDITARMEAEEIISKHREHLEELVYERTSELREAQDRLIESERLAVLGKFAGSIAHEIRNPLGVISNSAYYLKMVTPSDNPKIARHLNMISDQIRNTTAIIESILKLTRMEEPRKEKTDLGALLRTTVKAARVPARIETVLDVPESPININADREQMRMALKNIIKNAVQAIEGPGTITARADIHEDHIMISLTDTGSGIDPDKQDQIFQPLFTTKAYGIGFGLSIVKMIIEKHGGEITATSTPGEGSKFIIRLPMESMNEGFENA